MDNLGMGLKSELLALFEDDRKIKNIRFQEVFHLMDSNKNLINEHLGQQFEALKALTKAFVNKEVAERMVGDESILGNINKRLDGIDTLFDSKLKDEVKIMTEKMGEQMEIIEHEREENKTARKQLEDDVKKMEEEQNTKMQR
jgi:hypothetical protein